MASVLEIVEKLRRGEEVIIPSSHIDIFMEQIDSQDVGMVEPISIEIKGGHCYLKYESNKLYKQE